MPPLALPPFIAPPVAVRPPGLEVTNLHRDYGVIAVQVGRLRNRGYRVVDLLDLLDGHQCATPGSGSVLGSRAHA